MYCLQVACVEDTHGLMEAHTRLVSHHWWTSQVTVRWHHCEEGAVPVKLPRANRGQATPGREMSGEGPEAWAPVKMSADEKRYSEDKELVPRQWDLPTEKHTIITV